MNFCIVAAITEITEPAWMSCIHRANMDTVCILRATRLRCFMLCQLSGLRIAVAIEKGVFGAPDGGD